MYDFLDAVSPLQTLESLEFNVDGSGFNPIDPSVPETYQIPPHLHTLHFEMAWAPNLLELLFEMADEDAIVIPVFSSLSLQDGWPQGRSFLGRYLHNFGDQMHHLRLDCSSDNSMLNLCLILPTLKLIVTH